MRRMSFPLLFQRLSIAAAMALLFTLAARAQAPAQTSTQPSTAATPAPLPGAIASHPAWPAAKASDVESAEALVTALYDVISGPAGQPRNWERFRSLFLPEGRLAVVRAERPATADQPARAGDVAFLTPELYIERDDPLFKTQGFFERGIANRQEEFGNLVTVWSTYESRHNKSDANPFARGVNALTLVRARGRLWIASIVWDSERPGLVLPAKYLPQ